MILSWGTPDIEFASSANGAPEANAAWTHLPIPKSDTTKLTATAGTETVATEEGGGIVDVRNGKNSFQFEFDLFRKKGETPPFTQNDGLIAGEWAFRLTPEETSCPGILIERNALRVETSYTTADGIIDHYVARCLKPATGNTVKPYQAGA